MRSRLLSKIFLAFIFTTLESILIYGIGTV